MLYETALELIKSNQYYLDRQEYWRTRCFSDFPVLTKEEVASHADCFSKASLHSYVAFTSGSTGVPLKIVWDRMDYYDSMLSLWRIRKRYGIVASQLYLTCHNSAFLDGSFCADPIIIRGNRISFSKTIITNEQLISYIRNIELFKPFWIHAQPSFVYQLGVHLSQVAPKTLDCFHYIELVGELVSPAIKSSIECLFHNAIVTVLYGMQEFNGIMFGEKDLLKVLTDNVYVEILDNNFQNCSIGEEGEIIVTGLKNKLNPLIRYKTGDRGKKLIKDGGEVFVITQGRSNDTLLYNGINYDGSLFFHVILRYNALNEIPVIRFQVVYNDNYLLFFLYFQGGAVSKARLEEQLREIMIRDFNIDLEIRVSLVTDLSSFVSSCNKTKYFINTSQKGI